MTAPVYVVVPTWGETFVPRFVEVCLATLLAPGNLPALGRPCVVLCATRREEDWPELDAHPMVALARRHAEVRPVFLDLPNNSPAETGTVGMARAHLLGLLEAQRAGAVAAVCCADRVWSDGSLPRLVGMARPGLRMMMAPGFRASLEGLAPALGLGSGEPVAVSDRRLAALAIEKMHSQFVTWDADALSCGDDGPGGPWWRAAPDGVVVHSLNWEPVLVDFSHPWRHDVDPLRRWSIDGYYAWWNCTAPEHWRAVADSDELLFVDATSEAAHHVEPVATTVGVAEGFRRQRSTQGVDPLRQVLADVPFLLHGSDVDASWDAARARAAAAARESRVEPPERWQIQQEFVGYRFVASGPHRDVVLVHNHAYSVNRGEGSLERRLFRDSVQPHGRLEDALAACGIKQ